LAARLTKFNLVPWLKLYSGLKAPLSLTMNIHDPSQNPDSGLNYIHSFEAMGV